MTGCLCFYCAHDRADEHYRDRPFDDVVFRDLYHESGRIALRARLEYDRLTPDERAEVERRWAIRSEWEREQAHAAVEFDLL